MVIDITTSLCSNARSAVIVCQSFFIIWGCIVCIAYFVCGYRILAYTNQNSKVLVSLSAANSSSNIHENENKIRKKSFSDKISETIITSTSFPKTIPKTVHKTLKITFFTALLGLVCIALNCYSLFGIYGVLAPSHFPDPWPWLIYQSVFRFFELAMAGVMAYTTNGSKKKRSSTFKSSFRTSHSKG